ncbi:MAG: BatD family protein [Endomicrobium sp.]|uniref:BatD family protein n=1 Tax=Candidatus Endomicrobiellum pyrsonymphae TaxID=1408203 RepID=UPI003576A5AA|nr:BatD family protein [Endomicrobium sp.]
MLKKIVYSVILLFATVYLYADIISFRASIDKKTVPLNESFVYSITVSGDDQNFPEHQIGSIPEFNRFGTSISKSMSIINGKTSMSVTYEYTLVSRKIGKFTIPPAKVIFGCKTYLTESIEIEVTPAKSVHSQSVQNFPVSNNQQNSKKYQSSNSAGKAFVKATINKTTAYENEKLIYKFSFYTNVDLISNPEYYSPSFSGFWNDGSKPKSHFEVIDGLNYRVDEMETILYPVGTGVKTILPAKLKIAFMDFSVSDEIDEFFGLFANMGRRQIKILETKAIDVKILPLPKDDKPFNFSGAIGDFKIKASVDKINVKTNEPVTLTVTVSGNGNMKSVSNINFDLYDGLRKYETIVSNTLDNAKEFKTIFIPLISGEKKIPSATLSFFSPLKKRYEVIKTHSIKIQATGDAVYSDKGVENNTKINMRRKDINYNKSIESLELYNGHLLKNPVFYSIFIPFIVLLIFSVCYRLYSSNSGINPSKKLKKSGFINFQKLIKKAESKILNNNLKQALNLIYQALIEIVNIKTGVASDNLQQSQIFDNLQKSGVNGENIDKMKEILIKLNLYKFASVQLDKELISALLDDVKTVSLILK